jgi:short-subunit dehydrogenase
VDLPNCKTSIIQNFYGTIDLTEKILPYIVDYGKIITVGSTAGPMTWKKITNLELK